MKRAAYLSLALFVIAIPALVASAVLWHFNQATVFDTLPVQSDEMMYWHQAATFAEAGFNGGNYTAGELLPRIGRFYSWGAAAPIAYGTIGALFGWPLWAMTVINLALLAAASAAFIALARLKWEGLLWLGGLLATFHPFLIYSPTQYIEVANMAAALLVAGLFARLIRAYRDDQPAGRALWLVTGVILFFAAFNRFPWALLYAPLLLLVLRPKSVRGWIGALAASVPLMLLPTAIYALTSAPYPETILSRITSDPSLERAWSVFSGNVARNIALFMDGDHLELHVRAGVALAIAALTVVLIGSGIWWLRKKTAPAPVRGSLIEIGLAWYTLGALMLFIVTIYDIHGLRGYRMLSGTILMLVALCIAFRRRWLLAPLLVYQLAVFPYALYFYDNFTNFQTNPDKHARYAEYQPQLAGILVYDPDAPNAWCNTVLYDLYYLLGETSVMVATPPGFGLSITEAVFNGEMPAAPRSKYIALRDSHYLDYRDGLDLEPLLALPDGMLYLNRASDCRS